jgi:Na+/H+-dicarboxylate symporter
MHWIRHRSIQVLLAISLYLLAAPYLPAQAHQALYTASLFLKDLLLWLLPVTICFFIAHAIFSFEKKAPLFVLVLLLFEACSNGASVWYSYLCGHLAANHLEPISTQTMHEHFEPLWRLTFSRPAWWSPDKGSMVGFCLGLLAAFKLPELGSLLNRGKKAMETILTRFFARLIPLFILGFVARISQTNLLGQITAHYADLLGWLVLFLALYIALLFFIGSRGSPLSFFTHMKNLFPAAGMAFSSGCSLSTMPWTIEGTSKNLRNPDLAKALIPATTNIQQIGDCIVNSFLCFLIYTQFYGHTPPLSTWIPFSAVFVLARFATAAVLGGAIFIMLPIYEAYLGFTPEMGALILAFNVILDPIVTCGNVVANGALCRIFEKVWDRVWGGSTESSWKTPRSTPLE